MTYILPDKDFNSFEAKLTVSSWPDRHRYGGVEDLSTRPDLSLYNGQRRLKRLLDLIGALTGLLLFGPLMALIALLIKLDSPGPVFFTQQRAGENGRPFRIFKFRSMVTGAETQLAELIDIEGLPEPVFKLRNDPRVTRLGRFLRRTSLDELPQLFNVLRGEMSLVGPRPEEQWLVERYTPQQRQRLRGLPGVTGPMQINGRAELSLEERVRLEATYLANYSLEQDLKILLKTVVVVIKGRGAY